MIRLIGHDDNEKEFELYVDPSKVVFLIPEENAIRLDGSFIKVTKDSINKLLNILVDEHKTTE